MKNLLDFDFFLAPDVRYSGAWFTITLDDGTAVRRWTKLTRRGHALCSFSEDEGRRLRHLRVEFVKAA